MSRQDINNIEIKSPSTCSADEVARGLLIVAQGVVYPWHCDHMGHMNVMWYTGKFDEATWHLLSRVGITTSYLHANRRHMAAVQQETSYRRELFAGDLITIRSGILEIGDKVVRFYHEMLNSERCEVAAVSTITGVQVDSTTHKSCVFPSDILERGRGLMIHVASDAPLSVERAIVDRGAHAFNHHD